ncbi:MAG TPA: ABC transporter permease [Gemmatimonadaceae bacterium]|nr:ABC transporter permease [Gemmatimonadaceae bacterium]
MERGLRLLLGVFPPRFRARHGRELAELYRDLYLRARPRAGARFWLRVAADALPAGAAAWGDVVADKLSAVGSRLSALGSRRRTDLPRAESSQPGAALPPPREDHMGTLWQDVRYAVRSLTKSPGYAAVILVTLALGIGANTAIFSVINGVLLRPLPFAAGEQLLHLRQPAVAADVANDAFSVVEIADYRAQTRTLDGVVEYHSMPFTLLGRGEPRRVQSGVVSHDWFQMFGVRPLLGRAFRADDEREGADGVLVLSHEFWQREFGGDPAIVGATFEMNDRIHTVVGVLPKVPQYPNENDIYMPTTSCPFRMSEPARTIRQARGYDVYARMRPGATLEHARADLATVASRLHLEHADDYPAARGHQTTAVPLIQDLTESARPTLLVLLGTASFLLLIVCASVANLTLARLLRREREMALRTALGAGRWRLLRQLLTESTLLALAGGAAGLLLAYWGLDLLVAFAARFSPRAAEIGIDANVLLFALAVSLGTGVVLGLLPALPSRTSLVATLKEGAAAATPGSFSHRVRSTLIVSQVAVSCMLLIGAGLMLRSLVNLQRVNPGFRTENVLTARVDLNWTKYLQGQQARDFADRFLQRMQAEPGVTSVAVANILPLGGVSFSGPRPFQIEGRELPPGQQAPQAEIRPVSPDYFRTLGMALLGGRGFTEADRDSAPPVAVVNQTLARRYFPGEEVIGKRVSPNNGRSWVEIIGVVADTRYDGLDQDPVPEAYVPFALNGFRDQRVFIRTALDPAVMAERVRAAVREIDAAQPVTEVQTMAQVRRESIASPRLMTTLLALFAGLALVITATGLAGVIAFSVSQRTKEIGIRMALGAERGSVVHMVLRQGLGLAAIGLAIGVAGALVLARVLQGLLFGVGTRDPITFAAVVVVLLLVALAASAGPARRATAIDPMEALRTT